MNHQPATPLARSTLSPEAWVVLIVLAAISLPGCSKNGSSPVPPLPPMAASAAENAASSYVGAARCANCHRDAHASYGATAHSKALAEIDLGIEPADGEFSDPRSRRFYRVYRQAGQMRHEESIASSHGKRLVLADLPVKYVIGSGRFSRSYAVEQDGFLYESPATWYAATSAWSLSPGYETVNPGFQRPLEVRCLVCHAGRIDADPLSPQRVHFQALAIDCERCHGPGELHTAKWEASGSLGRVKSNAADSTIVNPARLTRSLSEDICAQCHLHSAATVEHRGRSLLGFRPGLPLADFVTHFGPQQPKAEMEVVGHIEQLRQSRCYQSDQTLTCLTCHNQHRDQAEVSTGATRRQSCLNCHAELDCGVTLERRRLQVADDDCTQCHMPRGATEIPHFAFTHHRIGIHSAQTSASSRADRSAAATLVSIEPTLDVSAADRDRNLGLAYVQFSDAPGESGRATRHRQQGRALLQKAAALGLRDPELEAALARLTWNVDDKASIQHALAAAAEPGISADGWATICYTLGTTYYQQNHPELAAPWLERALQSRPTADLWMMLSDCRTAGGDQTGALEAAEKAVSLAPDRPRYLQAVLELRRKSDSESVSPQDRDRLKQLWDYRAGLEAADPR